MKARLALVAMGCILLLTAAAGAEVCNLKIVTDASPDYTDMESLIHSVTAKWPTTVEKLYAMYWWNHVARRQCTPMTLHGMELTDPIMQFNDYGYTMCSTIAGINNGIWHNMGLNVRFWDIAVHTVPEVEYDGKWHMYDDSMSVLVTTCDGKSIAGIEEIAAEGACEASGGKKEKFHLALYHNMFVTQPGPNGCLTGAESAGRPATGYASCFRNRNFVWYQNYWDWGHRYSLNVRPNEVYTRNYTRLDGPYPFARTEGDLFKNNPKYFIAVPLPKDANPLETDLEFSSRSYRTRGTGVWDYQPSLTAADLNEIHSLSNIALMEPAGIRPDKVGQPAEAVFRVQSANVATSLELSATFARKTNDDVARISLSTDNGLHWADIWTASAVGDVPAKLELIKEVNGTYEIMVKVQMTAKASPQDVSLKNLHIRTYTQINSHTQPRLNIGKNTVYIGAGEQTERTVIWPDLQGDEYKKLIVDSKNIRTEKAHTGYGPVLVPANQEEEASLTYRLTAPRDMVSVTFGGRYQNLADNTNGRIALLYSLDDGKTWQEAWQQKGKPCPQAKGKFGSPTDEIHYQTVAIPKGNRDVLVKYSLNRFGLYALRAEASYLPGDGSFKPLEVTFAWKERQKDYSTIQRRHSQLVDKLPFKYTINVAGADHPEMVSLSVNQKGSAAVASTQPVKYGYSDGVENADAKKYVGTWTTWGKNLAVGKKYTFDKPCQNMGGSVDPDFKRLTDGLYGAPSNYGWEMSAGWADESPTIDLDLGKEESCAALGVNLHAQEGFTGDMAKEHQIEVLVSTDNKEFKSLGFVNLQPRYKDIPYNFMLCDTETMGGGKFFVIPDKPVKARYVRYKVTQVFKHWFFIDELLVLDSHKTEPWDIRIALPDEAPQAKPK